MPLNSIHTRNLSAAIELTAPMEQATGPHSALKNPIVRVMLYLILVLFLCAVGLGWYLISAHSAIRTVVPPPRQLPEGERSPGRDALLKGNYTEARHLLLEGANKDNPQDEYDLGMMEYRGQGGPVDKDGAVRWMQKAADAGYAPAQRWIKIYRFHPR